MSAETYEDEIENQAMHANHENHLCHLVGEGQMMTVAVYAQEANYICADCGRVAAKAENLCRPAKMSIVLGKEDA